MPDDPVFAEQLDADGSALGRPSIVMRREDGVCDFYVLNGSRPLHERIALGHDFVDMLADLHLVDWRSLGMDSFLPGADGNGADHAIDHWAATLHRIQVEPHPELVLIVQWLRANAPTAQATVLVHGDWKPGNALLVERDGRLKIGAMLDADLACLSLVATVASAG